MYQLEGIIKYYNSWCLAWLPEDFDKYYRSLLPKAWYVQPPMNKPHVSIIRKFEQPDRTNWGIYDNSSIIVDILEGVQTDGLYYWLDCFSDEVGFLRRKMGLSTFREGDGFSSYNCYHVTIGNVKCNESNSQRSGATLQKS